MTQGSGETGGYPEGKGLQSFVTGRQRMAQMWKTLFLAATVVGIIALLALLYNVINESFGYVAFQSEIDPSPGPLFDLSLEIVLKVSLDSIIPCYLKSYACPAIRGLG